MVTRMFIKKGIIQNLINLFRDNVVKTTSKEVCEEERMNFYLGPSLFKVSEKTFVGDYVGKFNYGHEYLTDKGLLLLDEPAQVVRTATIEEISHLESKRIKSTKSKSILFIEQI